MFPFLWSGGPQGAVEPLTPMLTGAAILREGYATVIRDGYDTELREGYATILNEGS